MKKFFAALAVIIFVTTAFATVLAASYVGNANTRKFHHADCSMVGKMKSANKVFMNSRDEAIAAGYVPCKRCNP